MIPALKRRDACRLTHPPSNRGTGYGKFTTPTGPLSPSNSSSASAIPVARRAAVSLGNAAQPPPRR